jgi:hypothetical protein
MDTKTILQTEADALQQRKPSAAVPEHVADDATRDGRSPRTAFVITATTAMAGVPAEYAWLIRRFGTMNQDWKVDLRSLGRNEAGGTIETFRLHLKGGARVDVHFDISSFHQL